MSIASRYTGTRYAPPTIKRGPDWFSGNPDTLVSFDLAGVLIRRGITIAEFAKMANTTVWQVKKWRIAGHCPAGLRALFVEPKFYLLDLKGREYRVYANHSDHGRRWRVWYRDESGRGISYSVGENEFGAYCSCPDAVRRTDDSLCKHADALVRFGMLTHREQPQAFMEHF